MATPDHEKRSQWEITWAVQRSQRYHARRESFFDRWNKVTLFASIIGGSAVFASFSEHAPWWLSLAGALLVLVLSSVDLVVGTSTMARRHNDLRRRYCELEAVMVRCLDPTPQDIANWKAERLAIESHEPPIYVALDLLCENELARSYPHTQDRERVHVPLYKVLTAQLYPWPES